MDRVCDNVFWIFLQICNDATCYIILLTVDFVQGTNSTYVFTNISGRPIIYRPTGIHSVWVWSYCVFASNQIQRWIVHIWFSNYMEWEENLKFPLVPWFTHHDSSWLTECHLLSWPCDQFQWLLYDYVINFKYFIFLFLRIIRVLSANVINFKSMMTFYSSENIQTVKSINFLACLTVALNMLFSFLEVHKLIYYNAPSPFKKWILRFNRVVLWDSASAWD